MKKTYTILVAVLAVISIIPLGASAQGAGGGGSNTGTGGGASVQVGSSGAGTQDQDRIQQQDQIRDPSTHTGTEPDQTQLQTRDQDRTQISATTSPAGTGSQAQQQTQNRLIIDPEHLQTRAGSAVQLQQMVQAREQELAQEAASTTPSDRPVIQNTNQMRLAVHALLAAQDLLGPIGQHVAQIATQMDNSLQTSANAQVQIQTRGFWMRFLFGGDAQAAGVIAQNVDQNQAQIQTLTQLLSQASSTPEVQTQLQTQLQAMQQEQNRLSQLAQQEQRQWGIFSWRF